MPPFRTSVLVSPILNSLQQDLAFITAPKNPFSDRGCQAASDMIPRRYVATKNCTVSELLTRNQSSICIECLRSDFWIF